MASGNHAPPIIVLVGPQMGENIGAAARVMKNFGLKELRLVSPRDGWPNPAAEAMAAGGADIIAAATLYDTTRDALADCHHIVAATARDRYMEKPVLTARELFADFGRNNIMSPKTAILFGCEKSGLSNEDVALAHAILSIPVSTEYGSLNLATAVGLVSYEWFQSEPPVRTDISDDHVAPQSELHGFFDALENALDERGFWKEPKKKPIMWRNIRALFLRSTPSSQEVRTLWGILKCLTIYRAEEKGE